MEAAKRSYLNADRILSFNSGSCINFFLSIELNLMIILEFEYNFKSHSILN